MARILKPFVRGGGWYPSNKWIPLVKNGGYTTQNGGGDEPEPPTPEVWKTVTGSIVSFVTSVAYPMRKLLAQIEPQQDLHGYDAPYPAGGGKNKLNPDGTSATNSGVTFTKASDGTWTTSGTAANLVAYPVGTINIKSGETYILSGCPSNGDVESYRLDVRKTAGAIYNNWTDTGNESTERIHTATEDATVRVYIRIYGGYNANGLTFKPMIRLSSVSDATFAPYSNICPISGWTGLSGVKSNGNLFDPDANPTKFIDASGNIVTNGTTSRTTEPIYINSGITKAWLKSSRAVGAICIASYDKDNHLLLRTAQLGVLSISQNIPSGTAYVRFAKYGTAGEECDLCANFGDTATEGFPAYTGTTITVSWQTEAGTVYGGTVDVVTGVLTVDRISVEYVGASGEGWTYSPSWSTGANTNAFYNTGILRDALYTDYDGIYCISNLFPALSRNTLASNDVPSIGYSGTYGSPYVSLRVLKAVASTAQEFKTWLQSNHLQVVYLLATPQTYQLTPQQISTLLGNNTVFVDCGDVEVEYLESGTPTVVT